MKPLKNKKIEVFGRKYSKEEVHNKGIIDFDHKNFSIEEEEKIRNELIPIRGQIMLIQGKQKISDLEK